VQTGGKDQLIVPYTLDCNDMRFAIQAGFTEGDQFERYLKDSFDTLYAEGQEGAPKMLSIGLHCRLVGRPGRVAALKRAIEYFQSKEGVWFATRQQIAQHWAREHPPVSALRITEMERDAFVGMFGGVFEHSPWVAERAFDLEFGPSHDCAAGAHSLLARAFRMASDDERLGVLRAHPDLAGKLAAAKRLTADSTAEQASAGLDALTDAERDSFTQLNTDYTAKFGFPFIIAVRDHDKGSILSAFQRRIEQDRDTEFTEACRQVERIAQLRLQEIFGV
jgi:OHCU decarboxylase